jgi:histidinol-phosphate aminotransferase
VLLDANENAYGPGLVLNSEGALQADGTGVATGASKPEIDFLGLNRYPDPYVQTSTENKTTPI